MGLVSMIASNNYIVVNKTLAQTFGLEEAVMLGELASEMEYWQQRGELKDGFFYSTIENVKDATTLTDKRQRSALKALKAAGIIDVKLAGLPAKRYVRINEQQLATILLNNDRQNGATSSAKMEELETPKRRTNNNNLKNNKNNNNKEIYTAVIDFLNQQAGTAYKATSKATQQHINARLAEGFTLDDFRAVIAKKCSEWKGDSKMAKYLRPETLFGTKFESYLNAPQQARGANGIAINSGSPSDLDGVF